MVRSQFIQSKSSMSCKKCGQVHKYRCPALNVRCTIWKKIRHFAKSCLNKNIEVVNAGNNSDSDNDSQDLLIR